MTRVLVAGVVSVRLSQQVPEFPVPLVSNQVVDGGLDVRLAGAGWSAATVARALGADVQLATYVGADPLGMVAEQGLRARGWYHRGIQVCAEQPRALVLYDAAGTRCGTTDLRAMWDLRYPVDVFGSLLDEQSTDVVLMASVGFTRPLIATTLARQVPIATDMQCVISADYPRKQDWLHAATIVSCSHEKLRDGPIEWVEALWHRFATPIVVIGCGADGALVATYEDRRIWHVGAPTPRGVRFVGGAGDTMLAAFVHQYFEHGDPVSALRHATLAAGWLVGGGPDYEFDLSAERLATLGARHGLPDARRER
ncbi:carbohydrate kinase family protein [Actinophytocola oryzae]|uniref:Sugar/nucleoside kinase (Ribokinase family) n=1 Tax=Actinophytocola oryzae TaxID=502181 RepID=A0A4R7W1M2_9PSEU|nr:carbohydrate kinase family protein [Actinophytocola oryzae]TDV56456.1 sugar/nucleoside kinase (ribokinase family) [Actinophytocola oryzae]